jgi:hypothetical protein
MLLRCLGKHALAYPKSQVEWSKKNRGQRHHTLYQATFQKSDLGLPAAEYPHLADVEIGRLVVR